MFKKHLFAGVVLAGVFATSTALAHVSVNTGPAAADKSQKITFGVGHGCSDALDVHHDTLTIRIDIPAGVTSVRALYLPGFGNPTLTKVGGEVTMVEWTKPAGGELADDDAYYEPTIRARMPNTPFVKMPFVIHQVCDDNGTPITLSWNDQNNNPSPKVTIVPARLNTTGWNKFTIPAGVTVAAADFGAYFGDALIVWKGAAAFSSNGNTAALIGTTPGVTLLSGDLAAGDEIWVRY